MDNDGKQTWGTWEELLLACAVHRHGTDSWNSVSAEIYKRSPNLHSLTANDCRHKYLDLKRRFSRKLALSGSNELESLSQISAASWLEELRKIRVDELRRELERYDISISSLQSKVKRLEEDRQRNSNENSDLDKIVEKKELNSSIQSVKNESVSPDRKENSSGTGSGYSEIAEQGRETMAESEGGANRRDEEMKEMSDVQSSASLPKKETSIENQSPSNKDSHIESQPFISFVEILLSQPCGSHFSRRLETQETPEYSKVIKQHIDFEIIRKRIEEGLYNNTSRNSFFRDLLLLINNAKVFYHKRSSEFKSAEQLHQLVMKQIMTSSSSFKRPIEKSSSSSKLSFTKPRMSVPVISCRKRTSLAPKPSGSNKKADDEDETFGEDDESVTLKKRGRKCSNVNRSKKKKGVASFLKRIETLEPISPTDPKQRAKRNNGRKREAASPPSSPPPPAKQTREASDEKEAVSSCSTRLKKRLRR